MFSMNNKKIKLTLIALSIALFTCAIASCIPVENEQVNIELFKDPEEMKTIVSTLKPGMNKDKVLEILKVPFEKFTYMSTEELQKSVYGNSQVQGSSEELEKFKSLMLTYKGYYLPYINTESKGTLGFGKMKINKKGYNLKLVIVLKDDKLVKASVDGSPTVDHNEDKYLWGSLAQKGTGIGMGF